MKIDLEKEGFVVRPSIIAGETCYLIFPSHIGAPWDKYNLKFRSVIQNAAGENISCGHSKFFNINEKPDLYPDPASHKDWVIEDKLDGSLIIVSRYKDALIVRTRGVVSVESHETGEEIMDLIRHYSIDKNPLLNQEYSLLFEHITPFLPIVIHYDKPELVLLDIIRHKDYFYMSKSFCDGVAKEIGVRRPQYYTFDSIEEIVKTCETLKGREGFVLSYNNNQNRIKLKSSEYLCAHRMKSEIGSIDKVIDLYFVLNRPSYEEFEKYINSKFDFEIFSICRGHVSIICDGMKEVENLVSYMKNFVAPLSPLKRVSRKDAATAIMQAYGQTNRSGMAFKLLDGKQLDDEDYKKLLYQIIKD